MNRKQPMSFRDYADAYCNQIGTDPLSENFDEDVYYNALDAYQSYLKRFKNQED